VYSTANPSLIAHRSHLRHTVLVQPVFMDPTAPLPLTPPPFVAAPPDAPSPSPTDLPPDCELKAEGEGGHWYGTRVQTIVLVERVQEGQGAKVVFIERDAYVLDGGKPRWSGVQRRLEFVV
jgi:hypothetical protein